nr:hypothetical protein CFP56_42037 [Quercus suber]
MSGKDPSLPASSRGLSLTKITPCGEHFLEELGASGLYDLSRALVRMKALQDRYVANEGVIRWFRKSQEIENKERAQYLEAVRTLNQELTTKTKALAEETSWLKEAEKVKTNLAMKLAALREQMEKARAHAVMEFRISQSFFDVCGVHYGDKFEDCLKQVRAAYPNLDLSQIIINDTVPPMLRGDDTISDETVDFVHTVKQEVKEANGVVIAQSTPDNLDTVMVPPVENPTTVEGLSVVNPTVPDTPPS